MGNHKATNMCVCKRLATKRRQSCNSNVISRSEINYRSVSRIIRHVEKSFDKRAQSLFIFEKMGLGNLSTIALSHEFWNNNLFFSLTVRTRTSLRDDAGYPFHICRGVVFRSFSSSFPIFLMDREISHAGRKI